MRKIKKQNKKLLVVKKMPPLHHVLPGESFDVRKSEVVKWLLNQEDILQHIFDIVNSQSESKKLIKYNASTKKWQGVDYD